jgi:hypothetical protein
MIGLIHQEKTSESMASSLDKLEEKMGHALFRKVCPLILTDRGSEFEKTELFEFNTKNGESRLQMFYCDPMH